MGRLRRRLSTCPTPEPLIGKPGTLVVNMLDGDGKLERSFDFSACARPVMAAEIALAFRQHHADKCPETRKGAFQALRTWFGFLEEHGTPIETMRDVDSGVLRAYIAWLDRKEWTKGSQHGAWSVIKQLVAWLKRNHSRTEFNQISKSRLMHSRARTQPPVREKCSIGQKWRKFWPQRAGT